MSKGPNARFEGLDMMSKGPNARFEGLDMMSKGPNARFEGLDMMSKGPNARFEGFTHWVKGSAACWRNFGVFWVNKNLMRREGLRVTLWGKIWVMKTAIALVLMLWLSESDSQSLYNLVPNYSFENHQNCSDCNLTNSYPWQHTTTSTFQSINYANSCIPSNSCGVPINILGYSYQQPRTGDASLMTYFRYQNNIGRGYAQTELKDSLKAGHCYYAEFYVNLANPATFSVNNLAMLISNTAVSQGTRDTPIIANPQIINYGNPVSPIDTVNWIKVSAIYIASGGEKYITIGNFKKDEQTDTLHTNFPLGVKKGEYYIDDVSVIPIDSIQFKADAGPDTAITIGDSVFIGTLLGGTITTTWY